MFKVICVMVILVASNVLANNEANDEVAVSKAVELIKGFEKFRSKSYWDNKQYSIGYGTKTTDKNEVIDEAEATRRMMSHVRKNVLPSIQLVKVPLTVNQKAALISFIYNIGSEAFERSTVLSELNKGNYSVVPAAMRMWCKTTANGKKEFTKGLARRRAYEVKLWLQP